MYRKLFMEWFENIFPNIAVRHSMMSTQEASPYHREANVWVHTLMVVRSYVDASPTTWSKKDLMGALMCAFHDTGKPMSEETVTRDDYSTYRRYNNHDTFSGNIFIDYYMSHPEYDIFKDLTPTDIHNTWVMIAYHMPYKLNKDRVESLYFHLEMNEMVDVFVAGVLADAKGRISDNQPETEARSKEWCVKFRNHNIDSISHTHKNFSNIVNLLCGCSGIGKSTYTEYVKSIRDDVSVHSMDSVRMELYSDDYREAFRMSCEDKDFGNKSMQDFTKKMKNSTYTIVDNTNLSWKRRKAYITTAKRTKNTTVATIFIASFEQVCEQQKNRTDKYIHPEAVKRMYYTHRPAILHEVDVINIEMKGK